MASPLVCWLSHYGKRAVRCDTRRLEHGVVDRNLFDIPGEREKSLWQRFVFPANEEIGCLVGIRHIVGRRRDQLVCGPFLAPALGADEEKIVRSIVGEGEIGDDARQDGGKST